VAEARSRPGITRRAGAGALLALAALPLLPALPWASTERPTGAITFYNSAGKTDVVVDLVGYFN